MADTPKSTALPSAELGDRFYVAAKATLAAIPVAGGPAAELFGAIIAPPLARRRDAWLQALADGLAELGRKIEGFDPEKLGDNEAFVSAVMEASQSAVRTHHQDKLDALRNAVLNIAKGTAPAEDEQAALLKFVDDLTSWHLRILKLFQDPAAVAPGLVTGDTMESLNEAVRRVYPELHSRPDFLTQIVRELNFAALIHVTPDDLAKRQGGVLDGFPLSWTTPLGNRLLAFIAGDGTRVRNLLNARRHFESVGLRDNTPRVGF